MFIETLLFYSILVSKSVLLHSSSVNYWYSIGLFIESGSRLDPKKYLIIDKLILLVELNLKPDKVLLKQGKIRRFQLSIFAGLGFEIHSKTKRRYSLAYFIAQKTSQANDIRFLYHFNNG